MGMTDTPARNGKGMGTAFRCRYGKPEWNIHAIGRAIDKASAGQSFQTTSSGLYFMTPAVCDKRRIRCPHE